MTIIQRLSLCLGLVITSPSFAMEELRTVNIIDTNEGQSLASVIGTEPICISVFGATPRYSSYELYKRTLKENCTELLDHYDLLVQRSKRSKAGLPVTATPRRLKGVEKRIISLLLALKEHPGLTTFREDLAQLSELELMQLFFASGFHHETLAENISTLVSTAQQCLVHVFVPSYFADLEHLKTMEHAPQALHQFLKNAASHYQRHYERTDSNTALRVCILIPPISYFTAMLHTTTCEKAKTDANVVIREIAAQLNPNCQFALLNQGLKEELDEMVAILHRAGLEKTAGRQFSLTDKKTGKRTHTFNPYVLVPQKALVPPRALISEKALASEKESIGKKYDYKTSPIIDQHLVSYIHKKHPTNVGYKTYLPVLVASACVILAIIMYERAIL